METLGSRIRLARDAAGLTQDQIAEHFKIRRVSVTQWEGDITRPAVAKLGELARLLRTSSEWLIDGIGDPPTAAASLPGDNPGGMHATPGKSGADAFVPAIVPGAQLVGERDFPIYAAAMGGAGHLIVNFDAIEMVKRPSILEGVPRAYGILVVGDSMEPAYRQGDMALVHPGLPPMRDEDVVLYDHAPNGEAQAMIKHLKGWTDREWIIEQWNPREEWREHRADWPTCHRVVGKYGRR